MEPYHETLMRAALTSMPEGAVPGAYSQGWLERLALRKMTRYAVDATDEDDG